MRRQYEKEFKVKVCKDIEKGKTKVTKISREYNISRTIVSRWVAEYKRYEKDAFTGNGNKLPSDVEKEYLKLRIKQLEPDNDILKKFDAFVKSQK